MSKKYQYKTTIEYVGPDGISRKARFRNSSHEAMIEQFHVVNEAIRLDNARIAERLARAKSILAGEVQSAPADESAPSP